MLRGNSEASPRGPLNSPRGPWRGPWRGSGRGPGRGRGNERGRSNWRGRGGTHRGENRISDVAPDIPSGRLITEFNLKDVTNPNISTTDARITNCRYAASYSIIGGKPPTIVVPAQPATWRPPELPIDLPGDQGDFFRDLNGASFPNYPMQPSVQAIFTLDNDFDPSSIDIMGCASSLGEIIRFSRSIDSTFRFDVEMIGDTLFLIRNHKDELIPDVRGYGHSFLNTFTSQEEGLKESKSHQRIISYELGGLKCLVRFECDGYLPSMDNSRSIAKKSESKKVPNAPGPDSIAIQAAGKCVSQPSILEIKTRSQARGEIDKSEHLPRLWVRQIPNFLTAYHTAGKFTEVQSSPVGQELIKWENDHQSEIRRFVSTLRQLITEVKRASHLKLAVCRTGKGPLQLRERSGETREALPRSWKEKWMRQPEQTDDPRSSSSDDDDDNRYPRSVSGKVSHSESDDSDDCFSFDYTACDTSCGYCGRCS
ncbi:hypothetical protein F5X96DRAFT_694454 [Biscogniauxia mediterranea]|nr:hypothetical protein F5X96DRAFT_694454 [Biscogniauxia mediterranea]